MNIFNMVKEAVSTREAAEYYGLKINRNGMCCCLFHNDRHPSMKVDKGFYCFSCGEKGDVIHFIEKLYGISQYDAAKKLVEDFQIQTENKALKINPTKRKIEKINPYQITQKFEKWEKYCIRVLSEYLHLLKNWKKQYDIVNIG